MGLPQAKRLYTVEEYFRLEGDARDRHEYHGGEILAMAGGSADHSLIITNLIADVHARLKGKPCRVYEGNLRVRAGAAPCYVYPDATVVCGHREFDPADPNGETVTNPRVVFEVLSPSTEAYDRGEKFDGYREAGPLEEYVLIWQRTPRVEVFTRQGDGTWSFVAVTGLDAAARLRALQVDLPLAEVYAGVEFPPPEPPPQDERRREDTGGGA